MNRKSAFSNLLAAVEKTTAGGFQKDDKEGYWYPERDKAGNAFATIRFLPSGNQDGAPFIKMHNHGFQGPGGKWMIENCPTTIGDQCPVCEANGTLWSSGIDSDKEIARKRKRKTSYVANIVVLQDQKHPENEGKVFLFKFGQKIFDKIVDKIKPQFEDEQPLNPFDPWEGADFKLKIRQVDQFANYDKSEFASQSELDLDIDELLTKCVDLDTFTAPSKFKSYDELKKKFDSVNGTSSSKPKVQESEEDDDSAFIAAQVSKQKSSKPSPKVEDEEDDDALSYFKKLAAEDD
jgi:hypothetical protein